MECSRLNLELDTGKLRSNTLNLLTKESTRRAQAPKVNYIHMLGKTKKKIIQTGIAWELAIQEAIQSFGRVYFP